MNWIEKWLTPFRMGTTNDLYHHAKFGGDRTTRAGCRCDNVLFVGPMSVFVTLRGRCAVRSKGYTLSRFCVIVYRLVMMPFLVFFRRDCPFRWAR